MRSSYPVNVGPLSSSGLIFRWACVVYTMTITWSGATAGNLILLRDGTDGTGNPNWLFAIPSAAGSQQFSWVDGKGFVNGLFLDQQASGNISVTLQYQALQPGATRSAKYAIEFNGSTDQLRTSGNPTVIPRRTVAAYDNTIADPDQSQFSCFGWFYARSGGEGDSGQLFGKGYNDFSGVQGRGYKMHLFAGGGGASKIGGNVRFGNGQDSDRSIAATANKDFTYNVWHHCGMVHNANLDKTTQIYLDGVASVQSSTTPGTGALLDDNDEAWIKSLPAQQFGVFAGAPLVLGDRRSGQAGFDGFIREFMFFHGKALSAAEVLGLYNGVIPSGLTAWFKFDEGQGSRVADVLGGNQLTFGQSRSDQVIAFTESNARWSKYSD